MKADKDDAPEYLRRKRSQSFGKWSLAIALVSEELFEESVNTRNQHNQTYYNDSKHLPTSAVDAVSIRLLVSQKPITLEWHLLSAIGLRKLFRHLLESKTHE
ncbi:TPA: hypothetical protein ACKRML_006264 [Pseudomonas aeruginosa]|uniref:hypothetical protein n=1 Tax=Pseudomonas aeruginosa TaxID=287 RepID=UPI001141775C|nr:hypothetical protein [Pseudomonas aeruginosa]MBH4117057.1 hypothetical protein [Pseudomonas aeruginosa]HEK3508140.1 hypothetical protein [Pseudomonas aeruginosa]HEK3510016.1 hypothetical protein [Pseudomonas aeruginosa]